MVFTNNLCTALCLFRTDRRQRSWPRPSWPIWCSDPGISWDSLWAGGRDDKKVVCGGGGGHSGERKRGETGQVGVFFQTYLTGPPPPPPPRLLRALNSVNWEFRTVSDRPGLASDLWHDLGRFIVPCCVSLSHSEKEKKGKLIINSIYCSRWVFFNYSPCRRSLLFICTPPTDMFSFSNSSRYHFFMSYGQEHRLWCQNWVWVLRPLLA